MGRPYLAFVCLLALGSSLGFGGCRQGRQGPGDGQAETKRLYDSVCAKCHGSDGRGGVPAAEGQPAPRNFRDAAFQASRSDDELKRAIRAGKGAMPPFGALFDDTQLALLVAYLRTFDPKK